MNYSLTEEAFRKLICSFKDKLNNHTHDEFITNSDLDAKFDTYVTEVELEAKGFVTEVDLDLKNYSTVEDLEHLSYELQDVSASLSTEINQLAEDIPTKVSELENDSGFLTAVPSEYVTETELTAKGYAKQSTLDEHTVDTVKHITAAERTSWDAKAEVSDIPTKFSQLTDDVGYVEETEFDGHTHLWTDITDRPFVTDTVDEVLIEHETLSSKTATKVGNSAKHTFAKAYEFDKFYGNITYKLIVNGVEYVSGGFSSNKTAVVFYNVPVGTGTVGAVAITNEQVTFMTGTYGAYELDISLHAVVHKLDEMHLPDDIGTVKTVNGVEPDGNGNIEIEFDEVDIDKYFASTISNTLKWDGNTEGLSNIANVVFKVSDETPSISEAQQGGYFKYVESGELKTFNFTAENIGSWNNDIYAIYGDVFGTIVVVSKDGSSHENYTNLEKGTYVRSDNGQYICEVTFNGYQFANQVLRGECLPEHEHLWRDIKDLPFGEVKNSNGDTIVSDEVVYGNYHKVSDAVPTLADINKGVQLTYRWVEDGKIAKESLTFDSTDQYYRISGNSKDIIITYDGMPLVVISSTGSSTIDGWTFDGITEAGTYFRQDDYYCTYSFTISEYTGYPYMFEKIPERYLPEDYIKQLATESLSADYIKQLIKEVIAEIVGTDTDGLQDINGDYLYDVLQNKLITKE